MPEMKIFVLGEYFLCFKIHVFSNVKYIYIWSDPGVNLQSRSLASLLRTRKDFARPSHEIRGRRPRGTPRKHRGIF